MTISKCRLCNQLTTYKFTKKIFNKDVKYYDCNHCGLLQTQKPYWLKKAYKNAINLEDTGLLTRNIRMAIFLFSFVKIFRLKNFKVLDYAGGYGVLTRLLRDLGIDAYWTDKYAENVFAKGFEKKNAKYQLISAFELFEHFENPKNEIKKLLKNQEIVIFSTEILKSPIDENWWYLSPSHGQHVNFYRLETLMYISKKYNFNLYTNSINLHIFSKTKLNKLKIKIIYRFYPIYFLINYFRIKSKTVSDSMKMVKK